MNSPSELRRCILLLKKLLTIMLKRESHATSVGWNFFTSFCPLYLFFKDPETDRITSSPVDLLVMFTTHISVLPFCLTLYGTVNSRVRPFSWYSYSRMTWPVGFMWLTRHLVLDFGRDITDSRSDATSINVISSPLSMDWQIPIGLSALQNKLTTEPDDECWTM